MEQGVERHNMTKSQGSWMGRKLCCILVVPLDLGNSEEGCIPPYQTVSNKRSWNEEMWQELTWHFCPTWSMDVSRLFVTSCATQQNLPQRRIKRVSNMRSGWNEETCHKHDTSVRLGRWSKRNDTSVRLFANGCTWLKTNNHFVSNYLWVHKNSYFHLSMASSKHLNHFFQCKAAGYSYWLFTKSRRRSQPISQDNAQYVPWQEKGISTFRG